MIEECIIDLLFLCALLCFGALSGSVSWLCAAIRAATSVIAAAALAIHPTNTARRKGLAIIVTGCATAASIADALCVAQVASKALRQNNGEPNAFAMGVKVDRPVVLSVIIAAHSISFIAAVCRSSRASAALGCRPNVGSLGASAAAILMYIAWVIDFKPSFARLPHTLCAVALLVGPITDLITTFAYRTPSRHLWWLCVIGFSLQHIILISSISILFGDPSFAGVAFLGHFYTKPFAKAQAVGLMTVVVTTSAHRLMATAPAQTLTANYYKDSIKTPAANAPVEWFAASLVCQ